MVTSAKNTSADKLLHAASDLIWQSGASGLRVDAVARSAELNKRLIYHYFGDKEGLVEAVYRRQVAVLMSPGSLSITSQQVLSDLLASVFAVGLPLQQDNTENSVNPAAVNPASVSRAMQIIWPRLMAGRYGSIVPARRIDRAPGQLTTVSVKHWHAFCEEVMSLLLVGAATMIRESVGPEKPRYRLSSQSRRAPS